MDQGQAKPPKPQSWNRYAYTEGNPLKYTDPDGDESRIEIQFNNEVQAVLEGRMSREQFQANLNARAAGAAFAVSLLVPGPEDVIIASAAGKLLSRVGAFFGKLFGKADEVADVAKAAGRAVDDATEISAEAQKGIRSLEKQIGEHQQKLEAYKASPGSFDNQGRLANAPSAEVRQRIVEGRVKKLENEIRKFQREIEKLRKRDRS